MRAPTIAELLRDPIVKRALEEAWVDSQPNDATHRHEEGGWIYIDTTTQTISVKRGPIGGRAHLDLNAPVEVPGSVIVGTFHTHPNPSAEGWEPGPSVDDTESAWILGVPCLIRADNGIYSTGPDSRRSGLVGDPLFPM